MKISYFEVSKVDIIYNKFIITDWIKNVVEKENKGVGSITYVLCNDEYLNEINMSHLQHDDYTDIITFDKSKENIVSGEIYISVERIIDNAEKFNVNKVSELHRVFIHGVLHLLGYKDKSDTEKVLMRSLEEKALLLLDTE